MAAATGSRARLLAAADTLFSERGFAATTTRDIADRAGVDAALIVRHFGSKVGLYIASLATQDTGTPPSLLHPDRALDMLGRVDAVGAGPIFQAALQKHPDDQVQTATRAALTSRIVEPLRVHFEEVDPEHATLKAEFIAAAFAGIALGRNSGAFPALGAATPAEVVELVLKAFSDNDAMQYCRAWKRPTLMM